MNSSRTVLPASPNSSTIFCCSVSATPPCMHRTALGLQAEPAGHAPRRSHLRVGTRSEKTTARVVAARADADLLELVDQRGELGGVRRRSIAGGQLREAVQRRAARRLGRRFLQPVARPSRAAPGGRRGTTSAGCTGTAAAGSVIASSRHLPAEPHVGQLVEDLLLGRAGRAVDRPGTGRGRPSWSPIWSRTSRADLGAAHVEVVDVLGRRSPSSSAIAAGSSRRISSAKDSLSPLCGVALASSSASVCAASRRASSLRLVPLLIRLCDSSMTTASQVVASRWWPYWPASLSVSTEMIDPLEVGERVAAGGDLLLDPLDADGVEPHERDREAGPQLLLELLQHLLRGDDQDPLAPAAADQLGQDQPDLQRLAQADHVGEQDPRPQAATAPARPGAAGRSAGRAGTGRRAPGPARSCGSGVRRSTASRKSRLCRNRATCPATSTVSSGRIAGCRRVP